MDRQGPAAARLQRLARLLPTAEIEQRRAEAVRTGAPALAWNTQLADAMERDAIAGTRPEGCTCLGSGGWNAYMISRDGEPETVIYANYCECPDGEEARESDARARLALETRRHANRVAEVWAEQIPARFANWTLATSLVPMPELVHRLSAPSEEDSWYLWGAHGRGKTGLAVGYARAWVDSPGDPAFLFRSVPDLLAELRSCYRDDGPSELDVIHRYREAPLLILDDLGAEQITGSGWVEDRLYQIIGGRHDNLMPVVFTANLDLPATAARIGERLTWRILEMCGEDHIIHVQGPNLRDSKRRP